jgi:hypothetical protein
MNLVCFTEERSAKEMLQIILPKILPDTYTLSTIISFEGKGDLDKQIEKKLKNYQTAGTCFLILRDQDSAICTKVKKKLLSKVISSGKGQVSIVRIACHELENFYLGDLTAVTKGFKLTAQLTQNSRKYRNADNLSNAKQELGKITGKKYQPISGSKKISPHLELTGKNTSASFNILLSGIRKLCNIQP